MSAARAQHPEDMLREIFESIRDDFVAVDRLWRFTHLNQRALERFRLETGRPLERDDVIGVVAWELFPELVGSPFHVELQRALDTQRPVQFEAVFPRGGGWLDVGAYPFGDGLSVFSRDIDARKRAERESARRAKQQAAIATLGLEALEDDGLQQLLQNASAVAAHTLEVEYSKVGELLPDGRSLLLRAGVGWREGIVGNEREAVGDDSQAGYALLCQEPVVAEHLPTERRFDGTRAAHDHGAVSGLAVVIDGTRRPFGVLTVLSKTRRDFSDNDVNFLQSIANVLATAAARERSDGALEAACASERSRIADHLHDGVLRDVGDALAIAIEARGRDDDVPGDPLACLTAALRRAGEGLRGAIYDLGLSRDEGRPFEELLQGLVGLHRGLPAGDDIVLELPSGSGADALGSAGSELLRILGEALTNARRHAAADTIRLRYSESGETIRAEVTDDGAGFDESRSPEPGRGLVGMRERSELLGAQLSVDSDLGAGTTVAIEVPRARREPPPDSRPDVRVLLVDDHVAVREAIAGAFEREPGFEVVGEAASLAEGRRVLDDVEVDVAVVDTGLPDGYGADLIKHLRGHNAHAQALVLSASLDRSQLARAIESGAGGALTKTARLEEVIEAVRRLGGGALLMPPSEVVELLRFAGREREREHDDRAAISSLTPREHDVLQALAEGLDSNAIAERLHIAVRTERNHVASILAKLGMHSRLQALVFALRYRLVEVRPSGSSDPIRA